MDVWVQIWVQCKMYCNNAIKYERMIHVWCIIFPYTMYHTKNSSFISLFGCEECWSAGLAMQHQNSANPTDIIDGYSYPIASGQKVYLLHEKWQVQSRYIREECQNQLCPFYDENPKNTGIFVLLCLSSNIASLKLVWAEWTNMCLKIVMQK